MSLLQAIQVCSEALDQAGTTYVQRAVRKGTGHPAVVIQPI